MCGRTSLVRRSCCQIRYHSRLSRHGLSKACEPLSCYKAGGYHPVDIDDHLNNGRYKVINKLGWGAFSTVWLARDTQSSEFVAIKILQAAASRTSKNRELDVLRLLRDTVASHPGQYHLVSMKDTFTSCSANGEHLCFVLSPTGQAVHDALLQRRLQPKERHTILKGMLLALSALHSNGIAHGDVHTRNLAMIPAPGDVDALPPPCTAKCSPGPDRPSALVDPVVWPQAPIKDVRLLDLGAAFVQPTPANRIPTCPEVRPPEAMGTNRLGLEVDVWAAGCTIFEVLTGTELFFAHEDSTARVDLTIDHLQSRLGDAGMLGAEAQHVAALISRMLQMQPKQRPTIDEVLEDVWFDRSVC